MPAANPMQQLPALVRVAAFDITFVPVRSDYAAAHGFQARFTAALQRIDYDPQAVSPEGAVDSIMHEIGHAIWWACGLLATDGEERIVAAQATAWTQVYRDNAWLLDWIGDALHPEEAGGIAGAELRRCLSCTSFAACVDRGRCRAEPPVPCPGCGKLLCTTRFKCDSWGPWASPPRRVRDQQ